MQARWREFSTSIDAIRMGEDARVADMTSSALFCNNTHGDVHDREVSWPSCE